MNTRQVVQFTITAYIDTDHDAYDDPEWIADAAAGALKSLYGIECIYGDIAELSADQ